MQMNTKLYLWKFSVIKIFNLIGFIEYLIFLYIYKYVHILSIMYTSFYFYIKIIWFKIV